MLCCIICERARDGDACRRKKNKRKKQNQRMRNKLDGKKSIGKNMGKHLQVGDHVTSSSKGIGNSRRMNEPAEQGKKMRDEHKRSAETATEHDIESGSYASSLSVDKGSSSWVRRQERSKQEKRDFSWSPSDDEVLNSWAQRQKKKNKEKRDECLVSSKEIVRSEATELSKHVSEVDDIGINLVETYHDILLHEGSGTGSPRKKLLVLDINGLLADIVYGAVQGYKADTEISRRSVFKRPFCDDFLAFCFERFNVGIWTSRQKKNMEPVLDFLMGNAKQNLLFCWDQEHCTDSLFNTTVDGTKPLFLKKLKKLWEKYEPNLPWELGEYNETNTLLLDDSPHKAICNPPFTAIFPHTYQYTNTEDNSLGPGGKLRMYLEGVAMAENVQKYVEESPFGEQEPITEQDPNWSRYLQVIKSCSSPERSGVNDHHL